MKRIDVEATLFSLIGGIILIVIVFLFVHTVNPHLDHQCVSKGGKVFSTPGHIHSCIY